MYRQKRRQEVKWHFRLSFNPGCSWETFSFTWSVIHILCVFSVCSFTSRLSIEVDLLQVMMANIGPADYNFEETLSTLRYANRAKNIANAPVVNEDPKDAMLRQFQEEIARLKTDLANRGQAQPQVAQVSAHPSHAATGSNTNSLLSPTRSSLAEKCLLGATHSNAMRQCRAEMHVADKTSCQSLSSVLIPYIMPLPCPDVRRKMA